MHIKILSLSGNYCIDKKPSAINWILGRCKSVTCESLIDEKDLEDIPDNVKEGLELIFVDNVDDVLKIALTKPLIPIEWDESESVNST